jgi:hypothetical protein
LLAGAAAGGVAGPPGLPVTADLWAHFDADWAPSIITDASGNVEEWRDLSGNDRHLTQTLLSLRPDTGTRTLNGLNVLDFDNSLNHSLAHSAAIGFATAAYTIFIVTGSDADSGSFLRFMSFHNAGGNANDYDNNNSFAITQGSTSSHLHVFQGSVNLGSGSSGATPIGTWTVRKNTGTNQYQITNPSGTTVQTTNSSSGTANGGFIVAGGYEGTILGTNKFNGPIGEIAIYSAQLNDTDRDSVRTYLINKWGT